MAMVEGSRGTRRIANRGSAGRGRAAVGQENRAGQRRTKRALVRQEHRLLCLAPAAKDGQGRSYADTTLLLWPLVRQDRHSRLAAYRGQPRTKWRRRLSRSSQRSQRKTWAIIRAQSLGRLSLRAKVAAGGRDFRSRCAVPRRRPQMAKWTMAR